jgi:hypothetical protein
VVQVAKNFLGKNERTRGKAAVRSTFVRFSVLIQKLITSGLPVIQEQSGHNACMRWQRDGSWKFAVMILNQ